MTILSIVFGILIFIQTIVIWTTRLKCIKDIFTVKTNSKEETVKMLGDVNKLTKLNYWIIEQFISDIEIRLQITNNKEETKHLEKQIKKFNEMRG